VVEDEEGREDLSELDEVLDEDGAELPEEAKETVRGNVGLATVTCLLTLDPVLVCLLA